VSDTKDDNLHAQRDDRVIEEIIELQREFYFEKKGRQTERRQRLRQIIERSIGSEGDK
jgi:hypothetical protein